MFARLVEFIIVTISNNPFEDEGNNNSKIIPSRTCRPSISNVFKTFLGGTAGAGKPMNLIDSLMVYRKPVQYGAMPHMTRDTWVTWYAWNCDKTSTADLEQYESL